MTGPLGNVKQGSLLKEGRKEGRKGIKEEGGQEGEQKKEIVIIFIYQIPTTEDPVSIFELENI